MLHNKNEFVRTYLSCRRDAHPSSEATLDVGRGDDPKVQTIFLALPSDPGVMVTSHWSATGQSLPKWAVCAMSGLPPIATDLRTLLVVRFVP